MGPAGLCATSTRRRLCSRPRSTIEKFNLDRYEIATLSPLRVLSDHTRPLRLFVGGDELPELKPQSATYAEAGEGRGLPIALGVLPGLHPYSILEKLARPEGTITRALVKLIEVNGGGETVTLAQARAPIWHMVVHALKIGICRRTEQFIPQGHLRCEHWRRGFSFLLPKAVDRWIC
jgi:hypothetical protein